MIKETLAKTVLNKHKKRDSWFLDEYSLNPYKSCEFNCVYCYIKGSKYGEVAKEGLVVKINAPELLEKELSRRAKKREYGFIALSSATEPWMYIEEKYEITRECLKVIAKYRFPVHCLTKSPLILRDAEILSEINKNAVLPEDLKGKLTSGVLITFSFCTLKDKIQKIFEPNAPRVEERLNAVKELKNLGFKVGIAFMPLLPHISDRENQIEEMLEVSQSLKIDYVFFGDLTLYGSGKKLYFRVLQKYFPELLSEYEKLYKKSFTADQKYRSQFYRKVQKLCKKHRLKPGISE